MPAAKNLTEAIPPAPAAAAFTMRPEQLAELLQVDVRTLQRWHSEGVGPRRLRLPGRSVRYLRSDVEAWLASQ